MSIFRIFLIQPIILLLLAFNANAQLFDYSKLSAVTEWDNGRTYFFFSDGTYGAYQNTENVFAADIGNTGKGWPGMAPFENRITAAVQWRNGATYFFLEGGTYVRFNKEKNLVDSDERRVDAGWPGMAPYEDDIVGVVAWSRDLTYFFLNDGTYVRFDNTQNRVTSTKRTKVDSGWRGLSVEQGSQIVGVTSWRPNGMTYIFLKNGTYLRYNGSVDQIDGGPNSTSQNWVDKEVLGTFARDETGFPGGIISTSDKPHVWLTQAAEGWMGRLPDDTPLTALTIPGTHDSGALRV